MKPDKLRTLPVVWSCLIRTHEHGTEAEAAACIARHEATDDLYAACEAIVAWDDDEDNLPVGRYVLRLGNAVEVSRAALAKARGEVTS